MRRLRHADLQQALRKGAPDAVYLLDGAEEFFHEEAVRLLESVVLEPGAAAVNKHVMRGDEIGLGELLDLAATYPMGGGGRLVVVRAADTLRMTSGDPLAAYLADPNLRTCLVFSDVEYDRRRTLHRLLEKHATCVDCAPLDDTRTALWIRERLRGRGYGIGADLAESIAAGLAGAPLARVAAEMDKLMSAIGAPRPVEIADLEVLAAVPRIADAFRIAALIARGEKGKALLAVRALLSEGEDPVPLLGAVAWHARNALRAVVAAGRRLPPREVQSIYGLDPVRMARFRSEVGRAGAPDLERLVRLCARADRELKGAGAKDPAHALERLIHAAARSEAAV